MMYILLIIIVSLIKVKKNQRKLVKTHMRFLEIDQLHLHGTFMGFFAPRHQYLNQYLNQIMGLRDRCH